MTRWLQPRCVVLALLACACRGEAGAAPGAAPGAATAAHGPAADEHRTLAQVQAAAEAADVAQLDATVASYEAALADLKTELFDLQQRLQQHEQQVEAQLSGDQEAAAEPLQAQQAALRVEIDALFARVVLLKERHGLYSTEFAERTRATSFDYTDF